MLFGLMALFYIRTTLQYSLHYGLPSRNYGLPAKYYVVAVKFLRLLYFKDSWKPVKCYMHVSYFSYFSFILPTFLLMVNTVNQL